MADAIDNDSHWAMFSLVSTSPNVCENLSSISSLVSGLFVSFTMIPSSFGRRFKVGMVQNNVKLAHLSSLTYTPRSCRFAVVLLDSVFHDVQLHDDFRWSSSVVPMRWELLWRLQISKVACCVFINCWPTIPQHHMLPQSPNPKSHSLSRGRSSRWRVFLWIT